MVSEGSSRPTRIKAQKRPLCSRGLTSLRADLSPVVALLCCTVFLLPSTGHLTLLGLKSCLQTAAALDMYCDCAVRVTQTLHGERRRLVGHISMTVVCTVVDVRQTCARVSRRQNAFP